MEEGRRLMQEPIDHFAVRLRQHADGGTRIRVKRTRPTHPLVIERTIVSEQVRAGAALDDRDGIDPDAHAREPPRRLAPGFEVARLPERVTRDPLEQQIANARLAEA